jgi:hypothetical protein
MTAWFVAAIPLLIMFFALGMERVEARLRQVAVAEKDVEEFLEQARPDEVGALFRQGIGRALELFRLRRRARRPPRPTAVAPLKAREQPATKPVPSQPRRAS